MSALALSLGGSLPRFEGPLDLLLALVRQNGYPLDRLPLAELTRQFAGFLKEAQTEEIELGGEFLETASWLILLKSRSLLPLGPGDTPPERELGVALVDHERARDLARSTAGALRSRLAETGLRAGYGDQVPTAEEQPLSLPRSPTVQDALLAARRAAEAARAYAAAAPPGPERFPVEERIASLVAQIQRLPPDTVVSTESWFLELEDEQPEARVTLVLALLEVARLQLALLRQSTAFGEILLKTPLQPDLPQTPA